MIRTEPWAAVVLAAGAGQRLGGLAKALIRIDGLTLIARLLDAINQSQASEIVVVLGHHADAIETALHHRADVRVVRLESAAEQSDSLRLGLATLDPGNAAVMVCLADQPLIDAAALAALRDAFMGRAAGLEMVVPWVQDAPGNPVMMSRLVVNELLAAASALSGKAWREQHRQRVMHWASNNAAYRTDLDTPADVERLRGTGRRVELPTAAPHCTPNAA